MEVLHYKINSFIVSCRDSSPILIIDLSIVSINTKKYVKICFILFIHYFFWDL